MKSLVSLVLGTGLAVLLFIGGFIGLTRLMAEEDPHRFANLDGTPLWTNAPVKVNPSAQDYERIAAAPVPPVFAAMAVELPPEEKEKLRMAAREAGDADPGLDQGTTGAVDPVELAATPHAHWCAGRYRSYRIEDNSYQPYGGPRRQCESPFMDDLQAAGAEGSEMAEEVAYRDIARSGLPSAEPAHLEDDAYAQNAQMPVNAHVEWCLQRYNSYRPQDNSYQPYGGPRRQCVSPFG